MSSNLEQIVVGGIRDRETIVSLGGYWHDVRMDYIADQLIYRGAHYLHNRPTSDGEWEIWKYTWDGTGVSRIEGPLKGAWDNRATLDWA